MNKLRSVIQQVIRVLLPICLIAVGVAGFQYYKSQETGVKRRPPKKQAMLVETVSLQPGDYHGTIQVMGTVVPDRTVQIKSKVGGEVVFVSPDFVRGGVVKKGDVLLTLDESDYRIEIQKAESALQKARSDLTIELGSQKIAREEYKLISQVAKDAVAATDLVLRKPQLAQARAAVKSAEADLEKAMLNKSRTTIRVPFNGLVLEKKVDKGSLVTVQESIATLVSVDYFHVESLVPPDQLQAINVDPEHGSQARIRSPFSNHSWQGRVIRTTGKISVSSRMAGVLVAVKDPLGLKTDSRPMMLDDHVVVDIQGRLFKQVVKLPRKLLRDQNTVWINADGQLEIRPVSVVWKQDGTIYISKGLTPEDAIIETDLPAPVPGMSLQNGKGTGK